GYTLVYDELETSLHPLIVQNIINLFMDPNYNKNNAQLIFTTHDTNLLNLSLIRKDQIYFVEKDSSLSSSNLYSLSDLKNVRKDENIESGYIKGKYGSIPFLINSSFNNWVK
ncbi:MAG: AAA family ATPase, partial [Clostridium sp.]